MTRRPVVLLGALLVALAAIAALGWALESPASAEEEVRTVAAGLRCPDCQALSVADSSSAAASEIRRQIAAQLAEGRSPDEVRQYFVDRYGEWILLAPRSPLPWLLPLGVVLLAMIGLVAWLATARRGNGAAEATPPMDERARAAVREDAEAIDA